MKRRSFRRLRTETNPSTAYHHHVYVVELDPQVAELAQVRKTNPKRNKELPCVYVGMTGLSPEERLEKHLNGIKSSYFVRKYGKSLLKDLYEHLNPMPYEAALVMESELAEELRAAGYTVTGGH